MAGETGSLAGSPASATRSPAQSTAEHVLDGHAGRIVVRRLAVQPLVVVGLIDTSGFLYVLHLAVGPGDEFLDDAAAVGDRGWPEGAGLLGER